MFCPQCGSQNTDSARFCLSCGSALVSDTPATPTPMPQATVFATPVAGMPFVTVRYAGFWIRFAAWVLDNIAVWVVMKVLNMALSAFISVALSFCIGWLYYALMESSEMQATVGKMVLGLYVTDMGGRRISFGKATARFFGKLVSTFILGIGYLLVGFTERKQALHDLIAGCLVMRR